MLLDASQLVIDGLIGYGLTSEVRGDTAAIIDATMRHKAERASMILALDVPSGIDATMGQALGAHIEADWTLTLALPKTGLTGAAVGTLYLADIGIPASVWQQLGIAYQNPFGDAFWSRSKPPSTLRLK